MHTKTTLPAALILGYTLCALLSCRKENVMVGSIPADSLAVFSASVNGTIWQTDSISAFLVNQYPNRDKIMTITGYTSNRVISISLKDTSMAGSNDSTVKIQQYNVSNWMSTAEFSYVNNWERIGRDFVWQQQGAAYNGQATVSASDGIARNISGTFNFMAQVISIDSTGLSVDTLQVTNGVFKNIPYTYFHHP